MRGDTIGLIQRFTLCKSLLWLLDVPRDQPLAQAPEASTREPILHNTP